MGRMIRYPIRTATPEQVVLFAVVLDTRNGTINVADNRVMIDRLTVADRNACAQAIQKVVASDFKILE
jgi:hypothetical protein